MAKQLPDALHMLWPWAGRDALRHRRGSWCLPNRLMVLPVLNLLDAHLAFNQLVYVGHHHGALDVHERKGRGDITEREKHEAVH